MNGLSLKYLEDLKISNEFSDEQLQVIEEALAWADISQVKRFANANYSSEKMEVVVDAIKQGVTEDTITTLLESEGDKFKLKELLEAANKGVDNELIKELDNENFTAASVNKVLKKAIPEKQTSQPDEITNEVLKVIEEQKQVQEQTLNSLNLLAQKMADFTEVQKSINVEMLAYMKNPPTINLEQATKVVSEAVGVPISSLPVKENDELESASQDYSDDEIMILNSISNKSIIKKVVKESINKNNTIFSKLYSKLFVKKEFQKELISIIIKKTLSSAQLEKIKMAIEQGLTERQLLALVKSNKTPEEMQQVIDLSKLTSVVFS